MVLTLDAPGFGARQPTPSRYTARKIAMSPSLSELLKLPPAERAELAMALWESLLAADVRESSS